MRLFSKSDRPTAEKLTARIDELTARAEALPAEIEEARADLARAMATGGDAKKLRSTVAELTAEAESIPAAVEALRAELREVEVDRLISERDAKLKSAATAAAKIEKARDAAAEAVAAFKAALDEHAATAGIEPRKCMPTDIPEVQNLIPGGARKIERDYAQRIANARRGPGHRERPQAHYVDADGHRRPIETRPANADGADRTHRVSIGPAPDHSREDSKRPRRPEKHGAAIQTELAAGV